MWCGWPAPHPCGLSGLPAGPGQLRQDTWEQAISDLTRGAPDLARVRAPPPAHLLQVPASLPLERPAPTTQPKPARRPSPASGLHCTQRDLAQLTIVGW
ncbi:unnamed protein product [Rangifer tarandus platyrhynchus]|uniref:Uncharacterized protein n=1 Tax=Rangifer tarandus platyrhynchus TaxID=3082113 RepID=A0AC59Z0C4_RANTA